MLEQVDFWTVHGWGFIFCACFFPRLTMLFATAHGGFLWWLGLLFVPRLQVAILATLHYGESNTWLVIVTWIWALSGESGEKKIIHGRTSRRETATI
jgi:hypothetical protein